MEKETKTSKVAVVSNVLLVICAIIICFMAYYINRLLADRDSLACLTTDQSAMIEEINKENTEKTVPETNSIAKEEKTSYETFMENYMKEMTKDLDYDAYVYEFLGSDERKYELPGIEEIRLDNKADLHIKFTDEFIKSKNSKYTAKDYVLEKDVFTFKVCPVGNGGYSDLIIVKSDGTAEKLSGVKLDQTGELNLEKLDIKNVIHIESYLYEDPEGGGACGYKLYSIDGTTISD